MSTAPGMFAQLAPLAARGRIVLLVTTSPEGLRVTVSQPDTHINVSVTGSADELDRDLVASLAAPAPADAPAAVADQVKAALATRPAATGTTPAPKKPARPAKKPAAKPKAPPPKAKPTAAKAPTPKRERKPARRENTATREQCLAEYATLRARFGDQLDRENFIRHGSTGRRFERLWSGWRAFAAEGVAFTQPDLFGATATPPATDQRGLDQTPDTERSIAADMGNQSACELDDAGNARPSSHTATQESSPHPMTPTPAGEPTGDPA